MNQPIRTLGAFALGGLVVAGAALTVHAGPAAAAPTATTAADPATHTITVSGSGKVTVIPDVARVTVGVTITKSTVKAARAAAASSMTKIIAAVKALGVADPDIQTVGLNLYPQYASGSSTRIAGYQISEQLQVVVRNLDNAGDVVDAAMANGATDMNGLSFELADPAKAMNDARAAAVTAAQASAQAMATAGHVTLGGVVSIADTNPVSPINYGTLRGVALDAALATPVQVGSQDVSVTVTVVFQIS